MRYSVRARDEVSLTLADLGTAPRLLAHKQAAAVQAPGAMMRTTLPARDEVGPDTPLRLGMAAALAIPARRNAVIKEPDERYAMTIKQESAKRGGPDAA